MAKAKPVRLRAEARSLYGVGWTSTRIARALGVHASTIHDWRRADAARGLAWASGDWRPCLARPCGTPQERLFAVLEELRGRGLRSRRVAEHVGVSKYHLSAVAHGRQRMTEPLARRFETVLGVCSVWLLTGGCRMEGRVPSRD